MSWQTEDCGCDICQKEEAWEEKHGTCYRCVHNLPCQIADENDELCCTVLDLIAAAI